jgi:hypothetical protein
VRKKLYEHVKTNIINADLIDPSKYLLHEYAKMCLIYDSLIRPNIIHIE